MKTNKRTNLPQIPNKRYFTIGEVGYLCCVKPHVLRYWEQEFPQLKPSKRRGNRRYYQREDVLMIRTIRGLLYDDGYTISGARIRLEGLIKEQRLLRNKQALEKIQHDKHIKTEQNKQIEEAFTPNSDFTDDKEDYLLNVNTADVKKAIGAGASDLSYSVKFSFSDTDGSQEQHVVDTRTQPREQLKEPVSSHTPENVHPQVSTSGNNDNLKSYKIAIKEVIAELEDIIAI